MFLCAQNVTEFLWRTFKLNYYSLNGAAITIWADMHMILNMAHVYRTHVISKSGYYYKVARNH